MPKDEPKNVENEFEQLKDEFEELKKQNQEYLSGWQRALADYSNFQKDMEKRQKEMIEYASASSAVELIPIYNNLKLALKHAPQEMAESDFIKGIEQIKKQFAQLLNGMGVEEIRTVGEEFDPNMHEAVECEENGDYESGKVYEEISAGYKIGDKVIIPAKVKVAK